MSDSPSPRLRATVIDHDADMIDLLTQLLEMHGFECEKHTRALPGIEALTASRPDLIVDADRVRERARGLLDEIRARTWSPGGASSS